MGQLYLLTLLVNLEVISIIQCTCWNEKKCSTAQVRRGSLDSSLGGTAIGERQVIENLKKGETYKFLGVLENPKQEDSSVLWGASKLACRDCQLYG